MIPYLLQIRDLVDRHLPMGTTGRKITEILSIILVVEGLSVLFLFSYAGFSVGLASLLLGSLVLLLLRREDGTALAEANTPGIRLVDYVFNRIGGEYVMLFSGALVIAAVFAYNGLFSPNPDLGDSDNLSILFGVVLMLYPLVYDRFRIEASFALIFIGLVVVLLVLPQAIMSLSSGIETSPVSNWYVHNMLAAPFAGILDLIGIPSSSVSNLVTIQFQDGSVHTLSISAYCAGLYSFSIFLSAFVAFVLTFEQLPNRVLAIVLSLGVVVAYTGNLFRMVIIGVSGYYWGIDALHWAHKNIGWMIFLAWSAAYWWLILGWISRRKCGHISGESS